MDIKEKIMTMPKIDLHLHLDGSLNIDYIKNTFKLSDKSISRFLIAPDKCEDLNDYLTRFDYPVSIMQTKEELYSALLTLLNDLKNQNVVYAEIRFAPQLHTEFLSQEEVVETLLSAKAQVDIKSNLILCLMRGDNNKEANYKTIEIAKKYLGKGVCALDLAGAEGLFKTENYKEEFAYAKSLDIPFTIHAGEADGPDSIVEAIMMGAKRIGHGVNASKDEDLVNYLANKKIPLEICVKSNIQTGICSSYKDHPLEYLYRKGVITTINTDNMTVSNTNLASEYLNIINNTSLTYEDLFKMNINSLEVSFLSEEEKKELFTKYFE